MCDIIGHMTRTMPLNLHQAWPVTEKDAPY